jgi:hypothetical protein
MARGAAGKVTVTIPEGSGIRLGCGHKTRRRENSRGCCYCVHHWAGEVLDRITIAFAIAKTITTGMNQNTKQAPK